MSALPERRTRPTIRCLQDDLGIELPTVDVDLGTIEHPLMDEARRVAPSAPRGQKRILAIDHPLVYRLRHGRWRGAAWLEEEAARFWLLAGAQRAAGSREDAYEVFVALQAAGRLMPDEGDRHRDALERNARAASRRPHCAPFALADAFMRREQDVAIRLADRVDMRLLVSAAGDEVWVAVSTRGAVGDYIDEPVRNVLFRMAFDAVHKAHPLLGRDPSPAQDPRRVRSLQQLLRSSDYPVSGLRDAVGRQEEAVDRFGRRHADVSQGRVASGGWPRVETEEDPVVRRTGRRETEHRAINDQ